MRSVLKREWNDWWKSHRSGNQKISSEHAERKGDGEKARRRWRRNGRFEGEEDGMNERMKQGDTKNRDVVERKARKWIGGWRVARERRKRTRRRGRRRG